MKTIMSTVVKFPLRYAILMGLLFIAGVTFYFFRGAEDPKLSTLVGGICGGLVVYIIGFLISIYEYKSIDRFRELGVKEVLPNRRDRVYYEKLVKDAREVVVVVGTSCSRFIDDFANRHNDDHLLIDALSKHEDLSVQLMIPTLKYMDCKSKKGFSASKDKYAQLLREFPGRIEIRQFDHEARYSFVRVDNDLVVGPVFLDTESKNSPAIHLDVNSEYARKYLKDFDRVWERSEPFK